MSFTSYQTLINSFKTEPLAQDWINFCKHIRATIQLEKEEYSPGEFINGKIHLTLDAKLQLSSVLCVLDGSIHGKNVPNSRGGRTLTESVTNLHIFFHVIKSGRHKLDVVVAAGTYEIPFYFQIPHTNLPGTMQTNCGWVEYRILVIVECPITWFGILSQKVFKLRPYFNLSTFKGQLAKQSWQTKSWIRDNNSHKFKLASLASDKKYKVLLSKCESLENMATFQLHCKLSDTMVAIAEDIHFEVNVTNPNAEVIESIRALIITRIIYTALQSHITTDTLIAATNTECPLKTRNILWKDKLTIPSTLISGSTLTALRQPIIVQYLFQVEVCRRGKENPFIGYTILVMGTLRHPTILKPTKHIMDLSQCQYPVGICSMHYPEDWNLMFKSGRIGYINTIVPGVKAGLEYLTQETGRCLSVTSLASASSVTSRRSSKSNPPQYWLLSSGRSSITSGLPTYEKALELQILAQEK